MYLIVDVKYHFIKQLFISMPFCKMCYDSGRSEYDTHNIKDSSGNIMCNYLRNIKCYNCGYFGHTPKYCKMPVKKIKKEVLPIQVTPKKEVNNDINHFAVLFQDCQDCEEECEEECEDYLPGVEEIVWGKGFSSTIGIRWVDVC